MTTKNTVIPLLDLALYHSNKAAFVEELRAACHTVGFFLLRNGISTRLADDMLAESRQFFQRPMAQKNQISYQHNPAFRGYMPLGVENTAGQLDHREQMEYAAEYPSDRAAWPPYERLKSPRNPWPTGFQPTLEPVTMEFAQQVCRVADCLRESLCLALDLDAETSADFNQKFATRQRQDDDDDKQENDNDQVPHWVVKMISYPPSPTGSSDDNPPQQQGVGAHTDTNFLTLVLQDDIGGLQAFSQGKWRNVPTEYGSSVLVCNLGEQAEIWSRGYFLATPHRVLCHSGRRTLHNDNGGNNDNNRISVPLFYNPSLSSVMEPLPHDKLARVVWDRDDAKHWRRNNNSMLTSVGENTFKSLARSHPQVFAQHHPDLRILADGKIVRAADEPGSE